MLLDLKYKVREYRLEFDIDLGVILTVLKGWFRGLNSYFWFRLKVYPFDSLIIIKPSYLLTIIFYSMLKIY